MLQSPVAELSDFLHAGFTTRSCTRAHFRPFQSPQEPWETFPMTSVSFEWGQWRRIFSDTTGLVFRSCVTCSKPRCSAKQFRKIHPFQCQLAERVSLTSLIIRSVQTPSRKQPPCHCPPLPSPHWASSLWYSLPGMFTSTAFGNQCPFWIPSAVLRTRRRGRKHARQKEQKTETVEKCLDLAWLEMNGSLIQSIRESNCTCPSSSKTLQIKHLILSGN